MSPRMRDALVARYDTSRYEDTARGDIDPTEFRVARDENTNAMAFDIDFASPGQRLIILYLSTVVSGDPGANSYRIPPIVIGELRASAAEKEAN